MSFLAPFIYLFSCPFLILRSKCTLEVIAQCVGNIFCHTIRYHCFRFPVDGLFVLQIALEPSETSSCQERHLTILLIRMLNTPIPIRVSLFRSSRFEQNC